MQYANRILIVMDLQPIMSEVVSYLTVSLKDRKESVSRYICEKT
jgi:hypothetical protein